MDKFDDFKQLLPDWVDADNFGDYQMNHSAEHVFAHAVTELFPGKIKLAVAHLAKNSFANDAKWEEKISEEDLQKIEDKMQEIVNADLPITRHEVSVEEAKEIFKNNPFKLEWLAEFAAQAKTITVYRTGDAYVDLCKGPHVESTGKIKAFKLLSIAGAYWRGDEKNEMLTRVYGVAFDSAEKLEKFLEQQEQAKLRDHRRLGKQLDLFSFSELVGSGLPLYSPRGAFIRRTLGNLVEELQTKEGYTQVWTPQIAKAELFKKSGHYEKYHEDMFRVVSNYSDDEMYLKPMNCPQHTQIYASKPRSYRDLPIRLTDFAMLYRDERPGELNGLARVRSFSQDDCHIFCTPEQVDAEIDKALQMTKYVMSLFNFDYRYRLSTRDPAHPEKYLGDPETWDRVEKWAVEIMERNQIPYYDGPGEAAFYAPKMDLMATDALGREWQLSTIQIDYVMPQRFDLTYVDSDGQEKSPVMLHRAILGSAERFMMIILEHFGGALPAWLSPEQVRIIPVNPAVMDYVQAIKRELEVNGISVELDDSDDRMQNKIRKAQEMKVPFMLIIGGREAEAKVISVRTRDGKEHQGLILRDFMTQLQQNISERRLDLSL
jgi:threonyl-tRNA synthetase